MPQIYAAPPKGDTTRRLVGWSRVHLAPGQSARVELALARRPLAHYDMHAQQWRFDAGR